MGLHWFSESLEPFWWCAVALLADAWLAAVEDDDGDFLGILGIDMTLGFEGDDWVGEKTSFSLRTFDGLNDVTAETLSTDEPFTSSSVMLMNLIFFLGGSVNVSRFSPGSLMRGLKSG